MSDCKKGGSATSRPALSPPLKWHCSGGKHYLAPKIVALMPPHTHYVEPYAGGLSVLLAKDPEGVSEVVNDLHRGLTNFWRVLQSPRLFAQFYRRVQATPFSEAEWQLATMYSSEDQVERAWNFFVECRQSYAGKCLNFSSVKSLRTRRGMNQHTSAWLSCVEGLPALTKRLARVAVLNRPAVDVIKQQDSDVTLFYLDPPYLHSTRDGHCLPYKHEMADADHRELLDTIIGCRSCVMLSGYPSEMYDHALSNWNRHTFDVANHAASGDSKRRMTEVLWTNF